jgi:hypothetical protein
MNEMWQWYTDQSIFVQCGIALVIGIIIGYLKG